MHIYLNDVEFILQTCLKLAIQFLKNMTHGEICMLNDMSDI